MTTFITRLTPAGPGVRLAVKDLIDVSGVPTTAGSLAVADTAGPATLDAACMAGARAAGAAVVGKANLYELAFGASGVNEWFGTPRNPLDPELVPGGSSSGSAVAVADGEAEIAYGSDTGGSIRVPSAFCGTVGLKTTHGRVPLAGVWPLAPSLDTVGPMASTVAAVTEGMALLEPGFRADPQPATRVGRLRPPDVVTDPRIDAAVDAALARSGLDVLEVELPDWLEALRAGGAILLAEAAQSNARLLADPVTRDKLGPRVRARLEDGTAVTAEQLRQARRYQQTWRACVADLLRTVALLVLPTAPLYPPPLADAGMHQRQYTQLTMPFNLAGLPALALPVPSEHRLPASLQLVGPAGGEGLLLTTGLLVEAAAG
ncbi:MAG: amidase [Streptosporangiaceae bacterium]|nr:amidase [Streptosporangiaceae bacterium]